MSSILKALKKLEQDPNGRTPPIDLRQRKTGPEKTIGRGSRRLRPRTIAFLVLFVPVLAIGGWLLLKYDLLPMEKFLPGKSMPQSKRAIATKMSPGAAPAPKKTGLEPRTGSPPMTRTAPRKQKVPARKTVVTSRTGARVPQSTEKAPPDFSGAQSKPPLRRPVRPPQTARAPISGSASSPLGDEPVLDGDDGAFAPSGRSPQPQAVDKPAVAEGSVLTGFSVQAIAWSRIPAERIAVVNGKVVRESESVEGMHVAQIGIDEVALTKDGKTWLLPCGR